MTEIGWIAFGCFIVFGVATYFTHKSFKNMNYDDPDVEHDLAEMGAGLVAMGVLFTTIGFILFIVDLFNIFGI